MSIQVERFGRSFDGVTAVEDISFQAEPGEIIGLLGTSGCGKSTILRGVAGLDTDYEGTIRISGKEVNGPSGELGIIFQEPRLMPWLTVLDNVCFGLEGPKEEQKQKALELLKVVGLEDFTGHYPKQLSGGMAQRTAIARALVTEPSTLLLDEPFSALDAFTKLQLQDMVLELWERYSPTMIIVTHDIDEALTLCDRIVILKGQPGELHDNVKVTPAKPRRKSDPKLAELKEYILESLDMTRNAQKEVRA